jgi:hypothetical protein
MLIKAAALSNAPRHRLARNDGVVHEALRCLYVGHGRWVWTLEENNGSMALPSYVTIFAEVVGLYPTTLMVCGC